MIGLMTIQAEVPRDSSLDEVRDIAIGIVEQIGEGSDGGGSQPGKAAVLKNRELARRHQSDALSLSEWVAQGVGGSTPAPRPRRTGHAGSRAIRGRSLPQRNNRTVGLFIPTEKAERVAVPATPDLNALVSNYKPPPSPRAKPLKPLRQRRSAGATLGTARRHQGHALPKTRGEEVHLTTLATATKRI